MIQDNLLKVGDYGKLTLPTVLGVNPWLIIVPFALVVSVVLLWMDRIDKQEAKRNKETNL